MNYFKLKARINLDELPLDSIVNESDFALMSPSGQFVQFEHIAEDKARPPYIVEPGIFSIIEKGDDLALEKTSFVKETILTSFCHTEKLSNKISSFFNKFHVYKKYGIEVPKRGMLLYGPPGTGKTSSIKLVANNYAADGKTSVVVWQTDKIGAGDVKSFVKTFEYKGVEKLILIAEDLGGVEIDEVKVKSQSSLLSLLDNQEKTFSIPVLILATTNHPEIFNGNLTNRPGRFSDKIEVGYPDSAARKDLFKFYLKDKVTEELLEKIGQKKYEKFSPAHLQEIMLRSEIYDLSIEASIDEIVEEIHKYEKMFQDKKRVLGINSDYDYD
jgi:AAA+ superfamily predicted ATPase